MTTGQMTKFLELLDQKGITPETFQERLTNGVLSDIFDASATFQSRDQWRQAFGLGNLVPDRIILSIDYTKSFEQMIAAGRYDWRNDDLNAKRFPIKGEGVEEVEAKLFHFDRNISSEEAIRLMEAEGWEIAKMEHLLAFGAAFPDEQRKFPIIGLGSVGEVDGNRYVPCLLRNASKPYLHLHWLVSDWNSSYRFLAVRKVTRDSVS